ncbi:MAG: hypothetical protein ACYTJ0_19395, partial [Planctomycetota bacterium]
MFHIGTGLVQPASMACLVASVLVVEPVMVQAEPPAGQAAIEDEVQPEPAELWEIRGGSTILRFDNELMEQLGLRVAKSKRLTRILPDPYVRRLSVKRDSTLTVEIRDGSVAGIAEGEILHIGHLTLVSELGRHRIGDIAIAPLGDDQAIWGARSREGDGGLMLVRTKVGFDGNAGTFTLTSAELRLTPAVAAALGDPLLAQVSLGTATVRGIVQWVGGSLPQAAQREEATAGGVADVEGGDMTFCQLYGLYQPTSARLGDIVGLSVATTSWNIGTADLMWFPIPDEEHPFIVMNMYRLKNDRIEMIGMSEIKHGFYALGSHQCGGPPCGWEPGHGAGDWLGTNCTDTYSAPLNAMQYGMGPKYEANPWTGD